MKSVSTPITVLRIDDIQQNFLNWNCQINVVEIGNSFILFIYTCNGQKDCENRINLTKDDGKNQFDYQSILSASHFFWLVGISFLERVLLKKSKNTLKKVQNMNA